MAKKKPGDEPATPTASAAIPATDGSTKGILRAPAEVLYAEEIDHLAKEDKYHKPAGWRMSPRAVLTVLSARLRRERSIT